MQLHVLRTSSAGNGYILENNDSALLIECGVRFSEVKKALGFKVWKIEGALLTHEHLDHARYVSDYLRHGIKVYSGAGTLEAMDVATHHNSVAVRSKQQLQFGSFQVMPFDVVHDTAQPFGFYINHPDIGNTLFVTDTNWLPFKFDGLNNLIIEANYCGEILDRNILEGYIPALVRDRVMRSHMSIKKLVGILKENDLSQVNNIVLIHLSDGNSNAADFERQVRQATGKTVIAADKNMTVNLNKTPF